MLVIALGVMVMVMMSSLVRTLEQTREAYYDRYRFADVFIDLVRAPDALKERVAVLEGVAQVETRVSGGALIDLASLATPVYAQMLSLPDFADPVLNKLYLGEGRMPAPRSSRTIFSVVSGSLITPVSVISTSRRFGSKPVLLRIDST